MVCALAAFLVTATIGYALVMGLRPTPLLRALADSSPLALFDLKPPEPERPEPPKPVEQPMSGGENGARPAPAAQPVKNSLEPPPSTPTQAPVPLITLPAPVLPAATEVAGSGEGSGANGAGNGAGGNGSGGGGTGAGRGSGGGGTFSQARQTGGRFRNSDFPPSARGAGRLKIGVRYAIGPSGGVDSCEVIESSGYAEVDAMTCNVIMERYRFRPARDPDGYAVTEVREEDYRWRVH